MEYERYENDPDFIKFPNDFEFERTDNGFKVNSTGGEFFPNKFWIPIIISLIVFSAVGGGLGFTYIKFYIQRFHELSEYFETIEYFLIFVFILCIFFLGMYLKKITDIQTVYDFSSAGVNISSKKGTVFIEKNNIVDIYVKDEIVYTKSGKYTRYHIFFKLKNPLFIPYTNQNKNIIEFFKDSELHDRIDKNVIRFILKEIQDTFGFNMTLS